ncbi:conjugative transposon protein TraM [Pedobacter aquatilis]|uniref:conjugative transposon protein TraM n=1 Tax=Pedobacter aquatilis TaxID=351343 RepID=UPI00293048A1|nr:conjugative transposon protein TraM [Pedobacter aquatilis]
MERKLKDKRIVLLVLPLIILPFLALGFYALDGGKGPGSLQVSSGINPALPSAKFKKDDPVDKMGFYESSTKDSLKKLGDRAFSGSPVKTTGTEVDLKSREIDDRLKRITAELENTQQDSKIVKTGLSRDAGGMKGDVDRLELLMKTMQAPKGEDEELRQLTNLMEKIVQVQNPQTVKPVAGITEPANNDVLFAAIPALVLDKQVLQQGSSMQVKLLDSLNINGIIIPSGTMLFGLCQLTNQRLLLDIKTIRLDNKIIPVDLTLYGLDGIKGIFAPDAVVAGALNSGTDNAIRGMNVISMDGSMGAQVAGAGIDAAKNLFSKKVKRVKVKVKSGLPVLLRNNADKRKAGNG